MDKFLIELRKTPFNGFHWGFDEYNRIRAWHRDTRIGPLTFCPITAVGYGIKQFRLPVCEVAWRIPSLELTQADLTNIMVAADTEKKIRPYITELRIRLLLAVGLVKRTALWSIPWT